MCHYDTWVNVSSQIAEIFRNLDFTLSGPCVAEICPCLAFPEALRGNMPREQSSGSLGRLGEIKKKPALFIVTKFSNFINKSIGSKCVQVKGRVAFRHPDARKTASGKAVRYISKPPIFSVFSIMGGSGADFDLNPDPFRVAQFPVCQLCLKYPFHI
jgi:hypothetical protein